MKTHISAIQTFIEELAKCNDSPDQEGITRLTYSSAHAKARTLIRKCMEEAGLTVREDAIGNIIGRREGLQPTAPAIAAGSHFDTVRNGGRFDGAAGVAAGLAVAQVLRDMNAALQHPYEVIALVEEEGARFSCAMIGGKTVAGLTEESEYDRLKDAEGVSMRQAASAFGVIGTSHMCSAARSPENMKAFLELHIEQGPTLYSRQIPLGIVDAIVGIRVKEYCVDGRADHAGTTPMRFRQDALLGSLSIIKAADDAVKTFTDQTVCTAGRIQVSPNVINVVPSSVVFTLDMRSRNVESLDVLQAKIDETVRALENTGLNISCRDTVHIAPVFMDQNIFGSFRNVAQKLNIDYLQMASGAGHDSMFMAKKIPTGMIFVPSKDGRSHCPEEWTDYESIRLGADVLLHTILELDQ